MKRSWKNFFAACLVFSLALILASCSSTRKNGAMEKKIDNPMSDSMGTMEKEKMHDSMSGPMENMENEKRDKMNKETLQEPMN